MIIKISKVSNPKSLIICLFTDHVNFLESIALHTPTMFFSEMLFCK